jgi:pimeloyl-[acyl-carrier protein] methyl ester esterase
VQTAITLLPGLDGTGVLFRPLCAQLDKKLQANVVAYPRDGILGYRELLPLVQNQLPNTPFVLLGESFSGPLALMAAATRPRVLRGVILCASFVQNPTCLPVSLLRHAAQPFLFRHFATLSRIKATMGGYLTTDLAKLSAEALADVRPEVLAHRVREVLNVNVASELATCPVPVLYLQGRYDHVVPSRNAKQMSSIFPSMQIIEIPAGHWVLQTQPALAANHIQRFIEKVVATN